MSVMGRQMQLESGEKIQIHRKKLERNQNRIETMKQLEAETQTLQQEIKVQERQHENIGFIPLDVLINGKTA